VNYRTNIYRENGLRVKNKEMGKGDSLLTEEEWGILLRGGGYLGSKGIVCLRKPSSATTPDILNQTRKLI